MVFAVDIRRGNKKNIFWRYQGFYFVLTVTYVHFSFFCKAHNVSIKELTGNFLSNWQSNLDSLWFVPINDGWIVTLFFILDKIPPTFYPTFSRFGAVLHIQTFFLTIHIKLLKAFHCISKCRKIFSTKKKHLNFLCSVLFIFHTSQFNSTIISIVYSRHLCTWIHTIHFLDLSTLPNGTEHY
jgi:hypothetical protein